MDDLKQRNITPTFRRRHELVTGVSQDIALYYTSRHIWGSYLLREPTCPDRP